MKILTFIFISLLFCLQGNSDQQKVEEYLNKLSSGKELTSDNILVNTAKLFLNTPYIANTLEINKEENLVVNLREVDCMTFVENCLALTLSMQSSQPDYSTFCDNLQKIRYRNGIIDGYPSRLHYSSDWIHNNDSTGIIHNITEEIGGKELPLYINFMSTHPESYKQLKAHPEDIDKIKEVEANINHRYHSYIPKGYISTCSNKIKNGDIIFFVTSVAGLDISHLGIAYWEKGQLTFIHASSKAMKVIINPEPLADYCQKSKSNNGIMVCRIP